jgi:hypothetical protein
VTILGRRLYRTVAVLGLRRIVICLVTMSRVGGVMIVPVGMFVRNGKLWLLKKMMDTMGRGRREKKNKKGNDPQGADGAEITKCCSHCVDNYLYLSSAFGQNILIKKTWPAQAQSAKLKLIIGGAKPTLRPCKLKLVQIGKPCWLRGNGPLDSISSP